MRQHPRCAPESEKNWLYTVYAAVLLKLLEDVSEPSRTQHHATAVQWFAFEPVEVAIVCAIVRLKPEQVYLEVARRLRARKLRSRQIAFIRWHLRHGDLLWQIRVPVEKVEQAVAA
jgi:hypothetical protein